ncbi:MAG: iron-sulfur cluster assembly accessory protein [Legionella sp.]|nr:iron-sulfur cluster assembly accessory protein [Legionella sp.]
MSDIIQVKGSQKDIVLTDNAKKHILAWLNKEEGALGVRFSLKKTGCSGLSYVVETVKVANDNDACQPFVNSYQIYIDKKSFPYLMGMEVDYRQSGLGSKFVFNNPNQTGQCGCGESFSVD